MNIQICQDVDSLSRQATVEFVRLANRAISSTGRFTVALAGGSTPRKLYDLLASEAFRTQVIWSNVEVFWGDERCVPPDHPDSNYRMAYEALLSQVPIPPDLIHRMPAERDDVAAAADEYERTIRESFDLADGEFPRFDLILLGMGDDGHTASLFPGTAAIHEQRRLVVAHYVEKFKTNRMTLTPPVLNGGHNVFFLVSGESKAATLKEVLQGESQPDRYPSQVVRPESGSLVWLIDRAAARLLDLAA
ncbi:MAG: 6-phosphogluconolactonase [Candidatus Latescibacteria bacterium]|nr:6-phosphogluconolactonase [Candidatus Latescibacterota bacterium]